jgi:hypothetical protein
MVSRNWVSSVHKILFWEDLIWWRIWIAAKAQRQGQSKTKGETLVRTNLCEKNSLVPFFFPYVWFSSSLSTLSSLSEKPGSIVATTLGYLKDNSNTPPKLNCSEGEQLVVLELLPFQWESKDLFPLGCYRWCYISDNEKPPNFLSGALICTNIYRSAFWENASLIDIQCDRT